MISQAILVTVVMLLDTVKCWKPKPVHTCPTRFGDPTIPFPFGTASSCNLDYSFLLTCNYSYNPPKPFLSLDSMEVADILLDGKIAVASSLPSDSHNSSGSQTGVALSMLSARNMDRYGFIQVSEERNKMSDGCVSWFDNVERVMYKACSVIGCSRPSLPAGITNFPVDTRSFGNISRRRRFRSPSDLKNPVPNILDWSVGNLSGHEFVGDSLSFGLQKHSGRFYQDIAEFKGDGKKDGSASSLELQISHSILFCIYSGFLLPAIAVSWIIWLRKKNKVVKLRRNLFIRNGGDLLESMQSSQKTLSLFTAEDLNKATDNYDDVNVVCQDPHLGFTYRGILPVVDCSVTIQFCHAFDRCNTGILITKLVSLSQICHRNVVKLLGCCLETQIPLLVYKFVTSRTLADCINDEFLARSLAWDIRLRIAADAAGALAYLHSATTGAIIHGSLNSSSILVDHGYAVKVSGFALTCSECSCVGDTVSSCLDPDSVSSGRLTEKSDVYSFGFVLAHLLTGTSVMGGEGNFAKYFVGSSSGGDLLGVLDDRLVTGDDNLGRLTQVAEIAKRCLSSSSQERPTMKEVAIALERVMIRDY